MNSYRADPDVVYYGVKKVREAQEVKEDCSVSSLQSICSGTTGRFQVRAISSLPVLFHLSGGPGLKFCASCGERSK